MRRTIIGAAAALTVFSAAMVSASSPSPSPAPAPTAAVSPVSQAKPVRTVRPVVVATHPHDRDAFTQGLVFRNGELFESTGTYGESTVRAVDLVSGRVRTRSFLDRRVFGEGMTIWNDKIFVLTWRERTCFVYSLDFIQSAQFNYEGEGWGLTHDDTSLIMSDGTSTIRFVDPATFNIVRSIQVREAGQELTRLNELELIHGILWANIWQTNRIVQINPATGDVVGALDLSALNSGADHGDVDAVLNGIAWDEKGDRIFVTGKRWPKLFEIRVPTPSSK